MPTQVVDCQGLDSLAIGRALAEADLETIRLDNVSGQLAGVGARVQTEASVEVSGSLGDFAFLLAEVANLEVGQDAGHATGHSFQSGRILVKGSAGDDFAAFAAGGFLVVYGQARHQCGHGLAGAEVVVRSAVGDRAGSGMRGGALVLGNGAGQQLGAGMRGGTIYVRGEIQSLSDDVQLIRKKDADSMRLSLLLARAGIKATGHDFKAYRAKAGGI